MERKSDDSLQILPTCTSPSMTFSADTVNTWWCHLTEDGKLVNQNSPKETSEGKCSQGSTSHRTELSTSLKPQEMETSYKSPFSLNSHRTPTVGTSDKLSYLRRDLKSKNETSKHGNYGYQSPYSSDSVGKTSQDPTSAYVSPFTASKKAPRLKIYPGVLGSSALRGLGQKYWEVEVACDVKVHLYGLPVFEAGITWGETADTSGLGDSAGNCWLLRMSTCYDHPDHVCAKAVHGCRPLSHSPVMECKKNERFVIKYGFLLNLDTREFVIVDLHKKDVLHVFENVDTSRDLWPVFGVFSRHRHHVTMRLVAGKDLRLDSGVTGVISKLCSRQPQERRRPSRPLSQTSLKYSMLVQTA